MPKRPRPFLTFRKFEILKLCFKVGMWGTKRSVLTPWAMNSTFWSSQMHKFCPNGENVEIYKIWQKTIFWKNCSTLGLWGAKRSILSPELRKYTLKQPRLADIPKRPRPFLTFRKFEILKLCIKIGIWGEGCQTKRNVLLSSENIVWSNPDWQKCRNGYALFWSFENLRFWNFLLR